MSFWEVALAALNDSDDDAKQSQRTSEDLHDQNLDEAVRVLSIGNGTS